jgi:hypothetical protein
MRHYFPVNETARVLRTNQLQGLRDTRAFEFTLRHASSIHLLYLPMEHPILAGQPK